MLVLRVLQKTAINDYFITSRNFRNFNRPNRHNNRIVTKFEPPSYTVHDYGKLKLSTLFKPFIFTVCFSGCSFVCSTIWQYEDMRRKAKIRWNNWESRFITPTYKKGAIRRKCHDWWASQTEGEKVALSIIGLNLCVFLCWRIPHLESFMLKYFCSSAAKKTLCLPMFFSTFSHYSAFHLMANMYVLYSFSTASVAYLGKEQFVALYCSAGVISSFTSYLCKILMSNPNPSLGASGAIMAILASYCLQFPNSELGVIFLPFLTIPAGYALKGIIALDTFGIFAKWKLLDHAAHLGGALWGIFYVHYGYYLIWENREFIINWWHDVRNK